MAEKFPKFGGRSRSYKHQTNINPKKSKLRHIIIKLWKTKDKENTERREEGVHVQQRTTNNLNVNRFLI